ncbi:MAG TPA: hypothetical protein VG273_18030, partial [Bryobacteraceae bacterium]|nr:hypothetical protein [Bryobacteraceae bacterium]
GTPAANDSSGLKHLNELTGGINQALNEPMGIGWTGAGWVHCDFVQMAANLSIPAGLIYAGAFLLTLMRLTVRVTGRGLSEEYRDLAIAVLLSFMTAGALMSTQAVSVLPQLAHPVWFSWLLAEIVSRKSSFEGRLRASRRPYLITANVKEPFPV